MPALNEELTVGDFVDWCKQGLARVGIRGEILIIDSSSDRTAEIAVERGARVLKTPRRGLGRAYIDALPFIRGRYIVMGDADCTYDFRELEPFVARFHEGYEFVMGSRWKGYIEPGAMPFLHRYLGTPVTTWILNVLYSSKFSDIHCGMRGITREALERIDLRSQSWEYASEMVLKAVRMELRTTEVPIRFLKDREGRLSHHKRAGWLEPWKAAWINLRAMFIYGTDFFVLKPGLAMLALGLILTLPLSFGAVTIGPITFSLYWMLAGVALTTLGLQNFYLGCLVTGHQRSDGSGALALAATLPLHAHRRDRRRPGARRVRVGSPARRPLRTVGLRAAGHRNGRLSRHHRHHVGDPRLHDIHVHADAALDRPAPDTGSPIGCLGNGCIARSASVRTGRSRTPSPVDRFGVWLSARALRRHVRSFAGKRLGDFGCGYHAHFTRSVLAELQCATVVDVALADDLMADERVTAIEGRLPEALAGVADASLDVVICISVLEHLWEPLDTLRELRRVVAPGGVCLVNVPSWRGKRALELSAFRLGLSPAEEMDDHKAYYDPRDLWPLLVRAGFLPHAISCSRHKLGLNTFAACRVDG